MFAASGARADARPERSRVDSVPRLSCDVQSSWRAARPSRRRRSRSRGAPPRSRRSRAARPSADRPRSAASPAAAGIGALEIPAGETTVARAGPPSLLITADSLGSARSSPSAAALTASVGGKARAAGRCAERDEAAAGEDHTPVGGDVDGHVRAEDLQAFHALVEVDVSDAVVRAAVLARDGEVGDVGARDAEVVGVLVEVAERDVERVAAAVAPPTPDIEPGTNASAMSAATRTSLRRGDVAGIAVSPSLVPSGSARARRNCRRPPGRCHIRRGSTTRSRPRLAGRVRRVGRVANAVAGLGEADRLVGDQADAERRDERRAWRAPATRRPRG